MSDVQDVFYWQLEREGLIVSARNVKALVYSLWSLLPAFCNYPVDTASGFEGLQKVLCDTIRGEPELRGIICSSLQVCRVWPLVFILFVNHFTWPSRLYIPMFVQLLIQQNRTMLTGNFDVSDDEMSIFEQKARACYTPQLAGENLNAIRSFSSEFFSALSEVFFKDLKDSGGCLQVIWHICTSGNLILYDVLLRLKNLWIFVFYLDIPGLNYFVHVLVTDCYYLRINNIFAQTSLSFSKSRGRLPTANVVI